MTGKKKNTRTHTHTKNKCEKKKKRKGRVRVGCGKCAAGPEQYVKACVLKCLLQSFQQTYLPPLHTHTHPRALQSPPAGQRPSAEHLSLIVFRQVRVTHPHLIIPAAFVAGDREVDVSSFFFPFSVFHFFFFFFLQISARLF